jgi:hypothetical protein
LNWEPVKADVTGARTAAAQSGIALHLDVLPNSEAKLLTRRTLERYRTVTAAKQFTNEDGGTAN